MRPCCSAGSHEQTTWRKTAGDTVRFGTWCNGQHVPHTDRSLLHYVWRTSSWRRSFSSLNLTFSDLTLADSSVTCEMLDSSSRRLSCGKHARRHVDLLNYRTKDMRFGRGSAEVPNGHLTLSNTHRAAVLQTPHSPLANTLNPQSTHGMACCTNCIPVHPACNSGEAGRKAATPRQLSAPTLLARLHKCTSNNSGSAMDTARVPLTRAPRA